MSHQTRKWIFRIGTLIVAGTLLYLGLRGVNLDSLGADLAAGRYIWAIPLFATTLISHLIRAFRWRLLIQALPEPAPKPVPVQRAFSALMIGYMINYLAPRFGEVVRTSHLSLREKRSFSGVFGTVVAERLLDVACLGVFLLTLPLVLGSRIRELYEIIARPLRDILAGSATEIVVISVLGLLVVGMGLFLVLRKAGARSSGGSVSAALQTFRTGLLTLGRSGHGFRIAVLTAAMWSCYAAMAYIPLRIFDLAGPDGLGPIDAWALMLIGSLGVVVPSPGGVGSYHFLTIQALVILWGSSQASAASYAIFTHIGQMMLYLVTGFIIILIEGIRWSELKSTSLQNASDAGIIDSSEQTR